MRSTKSEAEAAARAVYGREAYTSARRTLGNWWKVEVHVDSRGPGRSVVGSYEAGGGVANAYGDAVADLRAQARAGRGA